VDALEGGFDGQVMAAQTLIGHALKLALVMCFEMDEKFWPSTQKQIRVSVNSNVFEESYVPKKDINGVYQVDVSYGFAAGMDPNRALVFLLQMRGDKLIDRSFVLGQMPFDVDVNQTLQRVDNEELTDALKQGMFSMLTSMGVMAQQGADPTQLLTQAAKVISLRDKGVPGRPPWCGSNPRSGRPRGWRATRSGWPSGTRYGTTRWRYASRTAARWGSGSNDSSSRAEGWRRASRHGVRSQI
jgi:hypothetical protein